MSIQTNIFTEVNNPDRYSRVKVLNLGERLIKYCPITKYKYAQNRVYTEYDVMNQSYKHILKAYHSYYKVMDNTAILIPCYQEDWKAYIDNKTKKRKLNNTHKRFFIDYINLTKTKDNFRPQIIAPIPTDEAISNYIKSWEDITNDRTMPKNRKKKEIKKLPDATYTYKTMKKRDIQMVCEEFKNWLITHTKIKYVLLPDVIMAKYLFPQTSIGSSFNACAFEKFISYEYGRKITFMFTLNPIQISKYEESGFTLLSDILNVLHANPEPLKFRTNVIKSERELHTVLSRLQNEMNEDGRRKYSILSVDTETTGLNPNWYDQHIIAGGFSNGEESWVFLVDHPYYEKHKNINMISILMDYKFDFVFQNGKFDLKWIKKFTGKYPKGKVYDTMLIDHWLYERYGSLSKDLNLRPGLFSMALQTSRYLGYTTHKTMLDKYFVNIECENPRKLPKGSELKDINIKQLREEIERRMSDEREPNSWTYAKLPLLVMLRYLGLDCLITFKIFKEQIKRVRSECKGKLPRVITELLPKEMKMIAEMELNGAPIDYNDIISEIKKANKVMQTQSTIVYENLERELNIDSGDQIANYLIRNCGINYKELQTDERDPEKICTDTATLSKFMDKVPWIKNLIAYKKAMKARNTYLIPFIYHSYKGKLYYNLVLTGTATGRLSSNNPNMQNIPKTLGEGENLIRVKQVIKSPEGKTTLDADLKNAEAKVLTAVCHDPKLIKAINDDMDLHCYTASFAYNTPYEKLYEAHMIKEKDPAYASIKVTPQHKVWQKYRKAAKSTTFLVLYGGSAYGLANQLPSSYPMPDTKGMTRAQIDTIMNLKKEHDIKEAAKLIDMLKGSIYTILGETFDKSDIDILTKGYGRSLFDRRRRYEYTLPREIYKILCMAELDESFSKDDIKDFSPNQRPFRQNVNFMIQSSTSDYMQYFIAYINENLPEDINAKMWFTVHDSIVGEIDDNYEAKEKVKKVFDDAMYKYIPTLHDALKVDIGYSIDFTKEYCELCC